MSRRAPLASMKWVVVASCLASSAAFSAERGKEVPVRQARGELFSLNFGDSSGSGPQRTPVVEFWMRLLKTFSYRTGALRQR